MKNPPNPPCPTLPLLAAGMPGLTLITPRLRETRTGTQQKNGLRMHTVEPCRPFLAPAIRHFIACVTYGAVIGIFRNDEVSRLLYAAQIAHTTRRTRKPDRKNAASSAEKSRSGAIQTGLSAIQEPSSEPARAA